MIADVLGRREGDPAWWCAAGTDWTAHHRDLLDVSVVSGGSVTATTLDPADLGLARADPADLRGGSPTHNAGIARAVLDGAPGPIRDVVLLNAAAVLVAVEPTRGPLLELLRDAMISCARAIDSGAARARLARLIESGGRRAS